MTTENVRNELADTFAKVVEGVRATADRPALSIPVAIVPPWWPTLFTIDCEVCSRLAVRVYEGANFYSCNVLEQDGHSLNVCEACSRDLGGRPAVHEVPAALRAPRP